jgi:hypothetical protein
MAWSGVKLNIQDTRQSEHGESMEVSLELLLLAQTHHIGGILSRSRLDSVYGFRVISHLADRSSKLVGFVFGIEHADLGCCERESNEGSQMVENKFII